MRKIFFIVILIGLLFYSPVVLASERGLVKGDSDVVAVSNFNLTEGPGFFLPSSPLYFLDLLVNKLKVKMATSPLQEVQRRGAVAAERLAELKISLEANNPRGIDVALSNLIEHLDGIKTVLVKEKASGRDTSKLSEEMIAKLERDYEALQALMTVSDEIMLKKLEAVEIALSGAEDGVIDGLPNITKERVKLNKLTREMVKTAERAEASVSKTNQNAKEALKEANKSLKMKFGDEGPATESMVLDDDILRPFEDSIEQSDKALEEAAKVIEKARETVKFNVDDYSNNEGNTEMNEKKNMGGKQ